jgi:hypothetical protein
MMWGGVLHFVGSQICFVEDTGICISRQGNLP